MKCKILGCEEKVLTEDEEFKTKYSGYCEKHQQDVMKQDSQLEKQEWEDRNENP